MAAHRTRSLALLALGALALGGCASGATAAGMTIQPADLTRPANPSLGSTLGVGGVTGGSETNPMWTSQVGNGEFQQALVASLRAAGLYAESNPRYLLRANLVSLEQPFLGFDMRVTSTVEYEVVDAASGASLLKDKVVAPYTATVSDAFVGSKRLQLANERSVRKNIAALIDLLNARGLQGPISLRQAS
jgi:hypothetical protein